MTEHYPIVPPLESVEPSFTQLSQILDGLEHCFARESKRSYLRTWIRDWANQKITRAAQQGADQELQACINFVYDNELCDPDFHNDLRAARRSKLPSLKQSGFTALELLKQRTTDPDIIEPLSRAVEALSDD